MNRSPDTGNHDGPPAFRWAESDWRREVFVALKSANVRQVAYVPDAGHTSLIEACHADPDMTATVLTTEEEGVGVVAGADLGGERGVLLMQSSGVGNCVNGFSLLQVCGIPFLTLVTMRGEWQEFNPWQVPMGQTTESSFRTAGFLVYRVDRAEDVAPTMISSTTMAYECSERVAVLLSQRLIGAKVF